ncbi:MAG: hypothetical protein EB120_06190 [Proteobacteria bacterium]|nr:hypothetical protein [Pseudomonadota bacterium]
MNIKEKARLFMSRFHGRRDVYGRQWEHTTEDGTVKRGYNPVCDNYWKPNCHIRLKDGIPCSACEIRVYTPVSEDTVIKHITGEESQLVYLLHEDGTTRFGAIDFDMKPGKEEIGYTFDDVKRVAIIARRMKVPYGIARSTGAGFHLYFFFSEGIPSEKFHAFAMDLLDKAGIINIVHQGLKAVPEIFPKQLRITSGIGNGIKPPMIEPNFSKGKNCFVDDSNQVIIEQWEYLSKIPVITQEELNRVMEKEGIKVAEVSGLVGKKNTNKRTKWQPPLSGSYEKVLEGCQAFRNLKDKCLTGIQPSHFEGMAMFHMAMHTSDGLEWFQKNVPGWAKSDADLKQLQQSIDKDYAPWTCKKLQEVGVCVKGTKCFNKKPPIERVDGVVTVRNDLPESEWPEPSPIRYAFGSGEDYLAKLIKEVEDLKNEPEANIPQRLADLTKRATVFDSNQQAFLKNKIDSLKLIKKSDLAKMFKEAKAEKEKEFADTAKKRDDIIAVGSNLYQKIHPHGYAVIKPGKGNSEEVRTFATFDIYIEEERSVIDDNKKKSLTFVGKYRSQDREVQFEIPERTWWDTSEMLVFFSQIGGSSFNILPSDLPLLRQAVMEHDSHTARRKRTVFYGTQGWYDGSYLMPSVLVDKEGVKPNTSKPVDIRDKDHASNLDFKLLSDSELTETLLHFKRDFFQAFPRGPAMVGMGHSMMAGLISYLGLEFRPVLWLEGTSGYGKTELAKMLQRFWGDFKGPANWRTTGNSMTDYGYMFRDALLMADDYKAINLSQTTNVINTVHNAYEYSVRGALTKEGKQRGAKVNRSLYIMTGELTPENEASFIGRLILIAYPKVDQMKSRSAWEQCRVHSDNYRGVTPHYIHWVLQLDKSEIIKRLADVREELQAEVNNQTNDSRICNNLSLAYTGWQLFIQFLEYKGIIQNKESKTLLDECWAYIQDVKGLMVVRCSDEQAGNVFLSNLIALLVAGKARIQGLANFDEPNAEMVGFVDPQDDPDHAYLMPERVIEVVKKNVTGHITGSMTSVGNQLISSGVIVKHDRHRHTVQRRKQGIQASRFWLVSLSKMGLATKPRLVSKIPNSTEVRENADGLI